MQACTQAGYSLSQTVRMGFKAACLYSSHYFFSCLLFFFPSSLILFPKAWTESWQTLHHVQCYHDSQLGVPAHFATPTHTQSHSAQTETALLKLPALLSPVAISPPPNKGKEFITQLISPSPSEEFFPLQITLPWSFEKSQQEVLVGVSLFCRSVCLFVCMLSDRWEVKGCKTQIIHNQPWLLCQHTEAGYEQVKSYTS